MSKTKDPEAIFGETNWQVKQCELRRHNSWFGWWSEKVLL